MHFVAGIGFGICYITIVLNITAFPTWFLWPLAGSMFIVLMNMPPLSLSAKSSLGFVISSLGIFSLLLALMLAMPTMLISAGSIVAILGIIANSAVILANGIKMPVKADDPELETAEMYTHMNSTTKLSWLGDRIPIPIFGTLASVGDILIVLGLYVADLGLWLK